MKSTTTIRVLNNLAVNGIELYFDAKPEAKTIEQLKEYKFRWHNVKKCWYNKASKEVKNFVEALTNGSAIETVSTEEHPQAKTVKEVINKYGVKVGDIFTSSWGYDQTNVEAFQVVEVKNVFIKVREIALKSVGCGGCDMSDYVTAEKDGFLVKSYALESDDNSGVWKKPTNKYTNQVRIKIRHYNAYLSNPDVKHYRSWYA